VRHRVGFFSDRTVVKNVVEVILFVTTEIARLCGDDVWLFFAAPGRRVPSDLREPGSSRNSVVHDVKMVEDGVVRNPIRENAVVTHNRCRVNGI
jgi:hypothetical protein